MNKIIKIESFGSGNTIFTYENGERLAIAFNWETETNSRLSYPNHWESTIVEVRGVDGVYIDEYLEKKYGQAPANVPVDDVLKIMAYVGSLEVEK